MAEILVGPTWDLFTLLAKIESSPDTAVSLNFPEGQILLQNILNLKFLKKESQKFGKKVNLVTADIPGQNLVESLENDKVKASGVGKFGFVVGQDVAAGVGRGSPSGGIGALVARIRAVKSSFLATAVIVVGVVLLLGGALGGLYFLLPQAEVRLTIGSAVLVKSVEVIASTAVSEVAIEERVIPATALGVDGKGSLIQETTGRKTVGDKAIGVVTIYNKTDHEKVLPTGALLSFARPEGENLRYTLNSTVTVPAWTLAEAESTPQGTTITHVSGKANAAITAEDIGEDYNLSAGSTLNVALLSSDHFVAQNAEALAGGSSREVAVVSDGDQSQLRERLLSNLENQIGADLRSKTVGDQKFEDSAVEFTISLEEFDKAVGEEAEKLTLSLELAARTLVYSEENLNRLLENLLSEFVPSGFELSEGDKETEIAVSETDLEAGVVKFQAKVRGYVVPQFNEDELRTALVGKRLEEANRYLADLPNIVSSQIDLVPRLPGPLQRMPLKASRIRILLLKR
ncbi:baseplate J/gp47 family protein [Candidatus Parcubacteria bacterium]|nr:baseplate J/gp47 family protein [Candidatus Parcubacteria bacterium]